MIRMNSIFWAQLHGAATHFPIAFIFGATLFDAMGFFLRDSSKRRSFQETGYWLLILGGIGSVAAVVSGLGVSKGNPRGTELLLQHHLFVWAAFALIIGLTAWRIVVINNPSRRAFVIYLSILAVTCALISGAGWSGGELFIGR